MSEGLVQRLWSRRPRRHVRRVAKIEGKLPGQNPDLGDPNPQTPFVLSPRSRSSTRRARTAIVVDLRSEQPKDAQDESEADSSSDVEELDA